MGRYIFKPTNLHLENEDSLNYYLELYKESLSTGELLVDLTNYDIYIANNGLEYPIPIIKNLREKIINWIDSEDNPLNIFLKLNEKNQNEYSDINIKIENINKLMEQIKKQEEESLIADDYLNSYSRIDHEVKYFYKDLTNYINSKVKLTSSLELELEKIIDDFYKRYMTSLRRLHLLYERYYNMEIDNIETKNLKDFFDEMISFEDIINMGVETNAKLNKTDIMDPPNVEISISLSMPKEDFTEDPSSIDYDSLKEEFIDKDLQENKYESNYDGEISYPIYDTEDNKSKIKTISLINKTSAKSTKKYTVEEDPTDSTKIRFKYTINSQGDREL